MTLWQCIKRACYPKDWELEARFFDQRLRDCEQRGNEAAERLCELRGHIDRFDHFVTAAEITDIIKTLGAKRLDKSSSPPSWEPIL